MLGRSTLLTQIRTHWQDDRLPIFIAISAGWFLSIGIRMAYPVLLPSLRSYYDLSLTVAGLLLTVLWLAYALGQIPGGMMGDRVGEKLTLAASMAIAAGTLALIVFGGSPILLFVGTALLGFAIALFGVVRLTALADVYPDNVGTVHGFLGAIGDVGNTLLPPAVGFIAAATIWQLGLGVLIPIFILVAVALWMVVPRRTAPVEGDSNGLTRERLQQVYAEMREPPMVLGTLIMVFVLAISQAFVGFYPTYLIEIKNLPANGANALFALFFAFGIVVRPLCGNAYDRIGVRKTLFFITVVSGAGFALLPIVEGLVPLLLVTAIIAFKAGQGTVMLAYMTVVLDPEVQNTGLGISRTIFFLLAAGSPVVFGWIADQGYFDEAFGLLAGLSLLTALVILRLPPVSN